MKKTLKKLRFRKKTKINKRTKQTKRRQTRKRHIKGSGPLDKGFQTLGKTALSASKVIGRQTIGIGQEYAKSFAQDEMVGKQKFSKSIAAAQSPKSKINIGFGDENIDPNVYKFKIDTSSLVPTLR